MSIEVAPYRVLGAEFEISVKDPKQLEELSKLPEIAIVGRSNVGKSSLLNALVNQRSLARTSKTPGRTGALNYFRVRMEQELTKERRELFFVDLPGFGYAKTSHQERDSWRDLIDEYIGLHQALLGIILLVDSRRGPEAEELWFQEVFKSRLGIVVLTKADKLNRKELDAVRRSTATAFRSEPEDLIVTSAEKKRGLQEILTWVGELVYE